MSSKLPVSALELAVVTKDGNASTAIQRSVRVAQHIEKLGYERLWFAEHHNMEHIASSATSVLLGHIAGKTNTLILGSGGIMLPNHSPLVIAEQFGTLDAIYPGRIELGLGRAPGTDQTTALALRRNNLNTAFSFPSDVLELQGYFANQDLHAKVRAFPGEGANIPIWILGSSTDSAHLAARLGLPYAFAAHFAPAMCEEAIHIYKTEFRPSAHLDSPYAIVCVNAIGAATDAEAAFLANSLHMMFLGIVTNTRQPLSPPVPLPPMHPELANALHRMTAFTFTGTKESLRQQFTELQKQLGFDELMTTGYVYDEEALMESFSIVKAAADAV